MKSVNKILIVFVFLLFVSCRKSEKVILPINLDYINYNGEDFSIKKTNKNKKIVTCTDASCYVCLIKLVKYKKIIDLLIKNDSTIKSINYISAYDIEMAKPFLKTANFNYPVMIDSLDQIHKDNPTLMDSFFMLNSDNIVVASEKELLNKYK